jgi:hypothetical protein
MVATLLLSLYVIAPTLFLVRIYGWSRVFHEHLHLLATPKGAPWPVSNGDFVSGGELAIFGFGLPCWLALTFAIYPFLRLLLPRKREPDEEDIP